MKKFMICFLFHFKESVLTKTALIMAAVSFVGTIALIGGVSWWNSSQDDAEIVIFQNSEVYTLDASLLEIEGVSFSFKPFEDLELTKEELDAGEIDNIFVIEGTDMPNITSIYYDTSHFESELLISQLIGQQYLARVMAANDISADVADQLMAPIEVVHESLLDQEEMMIGSIISYIFGFALYLLLIICGQSIATSVVTEKSSRVMEVMISKINPLYMMFAKIISVLAVILTNVLSLVAAVVLCHFIGWVNLSSLLEGVLAVLEFPVIALGFTFVILGYFLYGLLFAAAGAMCSKVEDLQSVITPLTMAIIIPFIMNSFLPSHSPILAISSYIPFFSPFVTFDRFATGIAAPLEVGIVLTIMLVSIIILGKLAARIYVNGVMHYSDSVKLKDIKKLLQR